MTYNVNYYEIITLLFKNFKAKFMSNKRFIKNKYKDSSLNVEETKEQISQVLNKCNY